MSVKKTLIEKKDTHLPKTKNKIIIITKNKKELGLTKDELVKKIMNTFVGLETKTCNHLIYDSGGYEKSKRHIKVC